MNTCQNKMLWWNNCYHQLWIEYSLLYVRGLQGCADNYWNKNSNKLSDIKLFTIVEIDIFASDRTFWALCFSIRIMWVWPRIFLGSSNWGCHRERHLVQAQELNRTVTRWRPTDNRQCRLLQLYSHSNPPMENFWRWTQTLYNLDLVQKFNKND